MPLSPDDLSSLRRREGRWWLKRKDLRVLMLYLGCRSASADSKAECGRLFEQTEFDRRGGRPSGRPPGTSAPAPRTAIPASVGVVEQGAWIELRLETMHGARRGFGPGAIHREVCLDRVGRHGLQHHPVPSGPVLIERKSHGCFDGRARFGGRGLRSGVLSWTSVWRRTPGCGQACLTYAQPRDTQLA
jgi:hypothetical protein